MLQCVPRPPPDILPPSFQACSPCSINGNCPNVLYHPFSQTQSWAHVTHLWSWFLLVIWMKSPLFIGGLLFPPTLLAFLSYFFMIFQSNSKPSSQKLKVLTWNLLLNCITISTLFPTGGDITKCFQLVTQVDSALPEDHVLQALSHHTEPPTPHSVMLHGNLP